MQALDINFDQRDGVIQIILTTTPRWKNQAKPQRKQ